MTIMFSVLRGMRPDTSLDSLSHDIPGRETLITLMASGWTSNPDERPSFLSKQNISCSTCSEVSAVLRTGLTFFTVWGESPHIELYACRRNILP